jgi:hypothetical protein|tara:strand:- start:236 stop:424 length:189 start_codon:yes stop_codon:yes gene_type:complete
MNAREKLIQIQKDIKANRPKVKPYITSPSLQKQRQDKLTLAQESEWFASIEGNYNTSENYFK